MRKHLALATVLLLASAALAQAPAEAQLKTLLNDFLAAASHSPVSAADKQMFDRFFADDVIYTRSSGAVISKADIMKSLDEPADPKAPQASFSAEDVTVRQFGNTAVVTFRLVQKLGDGTTNSYRNTGTFVRRDKRWQAVAWQATKVAQEPAK